MGPMVMSEWQLVSSWRVCRDSEFGEALTRVGEKTTSPVPFLHAVRRVSEVMPDDGRIVALTYGNGSRTGSWQPWVAMGAAALMLTSARRSAPSTASFQKWNEVRQGTYQPPDRLHGPLLPMLPCGFATAADIDWGGVLSIRHLYDV